MQFNDDSRRLTYGIIATLIFHAALFVLLGYVDFSAATPISPLSIDLSEPVSEDLVDLPETEPEPDPEPAEQPVEPEIEEAEPDPEIQQEELSTELDPEPEPVEPQTPAETSPEARPPEPAMPQEPTVPQEAEPGADAFTDTLQPSESVDRESLRRSRPARPASPVPEEEGSFLAAEEARREAALEFIRRIDEQQQAIDDELAQLDDADSGAADGEAGNDDVVAIRSRVTEITGAADDGVSDNREGVSDGQRDTEPADVGAGDDIEWADGDARSRIVGDEIALTSSDIRLGRGTLYLQVSFNVNDRGIVQPGSVQIDEGAAILTLEAQSRLRETLQSWRFTASPGSPSVRGVLRLELRRL